MIARELAAAIDALIDRYPTQSSAGAGVNAPRSLLIHATSAMYEYYLAPSGLVYERDLDSVRGLDRVTDPDMVRETYAKAAARYPELAALAATDVTAPPSSFEDALLYPADIVVAWDDAAPGTLVACALDASGMHRLATRTVRPDERDAVLDGLGRAHALGATLGAYVWHVDLVSGFNVRGPGLRVSYLRAWDKLDVRTSRAIELIDRADQSVKRIIDNVDPQIASRIGRDLANYVEGHHHDNGVPYANADELAYVRACRELAARMDEYPSYKVQRELRLHASGVTLVLEDDMISVDTGGRRVPLRAAPRSAWFDAKLYLDRPWIIRDIVRATKND